MIRKGNGKKAPVRLSPQQIAVVIGVLTNALDVLSILIDKDQRIVIVLEGSFRKKTEGDRIAEELIEISAGPFKKRPQPLLLSSCRRNFKSKRRRL